MPKQAEKVQEWVDLDGNHKAFGRVETITDEIGGKLQMEIFKKRYDEGSEFESCNIKTVEEAEFLIVVLKDYVKGKKKELKSRKVLLIKRQCF